MNPGARGEGAAALADARAAAVVHGTAAVSEPPAWLSVDEATTVGPGGTLPVDEHWAGFGGAHGGLLVAAAARSMASVVPAGRMLRTIHADFHGGVRPGELELVPRVDRDGRSVTFAGAVGSQGGRSRITATGVFGADAGGIPYGPAPRGSMPDAPPPSASATVDMTGTPALHTIEYRPAIGPMPLHGHDAAELICWMAIGGDDGDVDEARALTLLDAPAPGIYATLTSPIAMPTVELTAHLFPALRASGSRWVLARMQTVMAAEGYALDDCELWSQGGDLLAIARQTRMMLGV